MIHPSVEQFAKAMTFAGLAPCPQDGRWEIPTDSDICTEVETISLVFGFVRALRPKVVVETGCNVGCVSKAILSALEANGGGALYTCDTEMAHVQATSARLGLGTQHVGATATNETVRAYVANVSGTWLVQNLFTGTGEHLPVDLYFIDSSDESRMAELRAIRLHGKKGAVVLTHDTNLIGHVTEVVRTLPNWVLLPGPRGLGVATL